ncbi:MAG: sulfotransferase [Verrucomicrobia bacterium]|nr:sulfotransferase [Verrucomicrobiota bacterium]
MKMDSRRWFKVETRRREIMEALARDNHAAAACDAMRKLAVREPMAPAVQMDLVTLATMVSEYDLALAAAGRLLRIAPGDFLAMSHAADAFLQCGREDKALEAWRTIKLPAHRPAAMTAMARIAERGGRPEEAAAWVERALALDPRDAMSVLLAGQLASRRGEFERATALLEHCALPVVPATLRCQALYELGEVRDRTDDPAGAVAAWRAAKRCIEEGFAPQVDLGRRVRRKILERNRALVAELTPTLIRHWRCQPPACEMPPLALLAGHPRSGTTLLEQVLAAHPAVIDIDEKDALACALRETLFPEVPAGPNLQDLDAMPAEALEGVRRDYLRRIAMLRDLRGADRFILDKNPNLTDFLPFLLRPFPELRILVARRDPRDILLSCFRLPVLPQTGNTGWLREDHAAEDYRSMMGVWEKLREGLADDTAWLEVSYENLCTDFENEARKITGFLGLDWHPAQADYRQTRAAGQAASSPSYAAVRAPVHSGSIGRWRRYADLLPELFAPFSQ